MGLFQWLLHLIDGKLVLKIVLFFCLHVSLVLCWLVQRKPEHPQSILSWKGLKDHGIQLLALPRTAQHPHPAPESLPHAP